MYVCDICSNKHISKYLFLNSYTFWNWNIQGMFSTPFDIFAKQFVQNHFYYFSKQLYSVASQTPTNIWWRALQQ